MRKYLINNLVYFWFFLCWFLALGAIAASTKEALDSLLKEKGLKQGSLHDAETSIVFLGNKLVIDSQGLFYRENDQGKRYPLGIEYDGTYAPKRVFTVFDPQSPPMAGLVPNPMSTVSATEAQINFFDRAASKMRKRGIATMKYQNSQCYYEYGKQRLGKDYLERLLALERAENPRPLAFLTDDDWEDFKRDLRDIFSPFKSSDSFIAILGTSTSFFSENPRKGKNRPLFNGPPDCITNAQNPNLAKDVYTFDTPGNEASDIDVDILIPPLSALCEQASAPGNDGVRDVYFENTMDKCIRLSPVFANSVKAVADRAQSLKKALVPGSKLERFFKKWESKLGREINFSIVIRPDQRKGSLHEPISDFSKEPYMNSRFLIDVK